MPYMNLPKIHFKDLNEREYLEFFKSLIEYFEKSNKSFFEILLGLARSYEDLEPYLESKTHTLKESVEHHFAIEETHKNGSATFVLCRIRPEFKDLLSTTPNF